MVASPPPLQELGDAYSAESLRAPRTGGETIPPGCNSMGFLAMTDRFTAVSHKQKKNHLHSFRGEGKASPHYISYSRISDLVLFLPRGTNLVQECQIWRDCSLRIRRVLPGRDYFSSSVSFCLASSASCVPGCLSTSSCRYFLACCTLLSSSRDKPNLYRALGTLVPVE